MRHVMRITRDGPGEADAPAPDRIVHGQPEFTTWNAEEADGLFAGIWQGTPGRWRISYTEWEFCHILSGRSILHGPDGAMEVGPGDSFILQPGFEGEWEVLETTVKEYVVRV